MSHLESAVSHPHRGPELEDIQPPASQDSDSVLVSVVIPAYRCAQYIVQGIESVLNQSFSNHEILVVNDGSPDTAELEAALSPYAGRIRYFKQSTKGPSGARNTGIRNAFGKYVAFLDGDDYWTPDHLAKNIGILERDPTLALVYCDCILVKNGQPYSRVFYVQNQPSTVTFETLLLQSSTISTSSVVVSRETILAAGGFDEALYRCEDFDMWLRLAFSGGRMAYHPDAEVYHRMHEVSLSADSLAMIKDRVRVYNKTVSSLDISKEQKQIIRRMVTKSQSDGYIEQLKDALDREDYAEAREAAERALSVESTWKLRLAKLGLRVSPRAFGLLHRSRLLFLQKRKQDIDSVVGNGQPVSQA
ncbi:MAG TPA: glycosyltransferase family A protein [Terriglobales bacterium]|nr:glycosyltransferase family A protein [Terriglobales bacterium]